MKPFGNDSAGRPVKIPATLRLLDKDDRMTGLITAPLRASRHFAIWLVWQSTGVSLLEAEARRGATLRRLDPSHDGRHQAA